MSVVLSVSGGFSRSHRMQRLFRFFVLIVALVVLPMACRAEWRAARVPTPTVTQASASALQVFVEPDDGTRPVVSTLSAAFKSIRMEMYLLNDREIIDALKAARGRGVDVRVMLEPQPLGGGAGNRSAMNELQAANVAVKPSNPAYKLTHAKMIVVDDRVALIMTCNQTRASFTNNREFGIINTDASDVAEIAAVFDADWNRTVPSVSSPNLMWSPLNARARILTLIDSAQQTLDIENEEMQDADVVARLVSAAQRGVAVRVVMSPASGGVDPNAPGQDKITRGGVKLRLVKTPYIHAKMIVADDARAFVGSQNFSAASLDSNRELGILVSDPKIIQTLSVTFANDWNIGK